MKIIKILLLLSVLLPAQDFEEFGFFPDGGLGLAVNSWNERVIANGGTTDLTLSVALDQFDRDISAFRNKIFRLNFFIGANLNSVIVPFYYNLDNSATPLGNSTDVNSNFGAGDYSTTTGLLGNGSTKYLATGFNPSTVSEFGSSNAGFFIFSHTALTGGIEIGTNDGANQSRLEIIISGPAVRGSMNTITIGQASTSGAAGFFGIVRRTSSNVNLYENGILLGSPLTATTTKPNSNIDIFRWGGVGSFYSSNRLKGYAITAGLTDSEVLLLYQAWVRFHTAIGR